MMLREPFIKAFWLTFIVVCGVFIASHLTGCLPVDLAYCAANPRKCN